MKDITRIHIAKIIYNIEIDAKKVLDPYIESLEAYAEDEELSNDIEIRITELLSDRGVKADGVILKADVAAVRKQLGEPKEFLGDGDLISDDDTVLSTKKVRKLYRNIDNGLVGGVLSGIASYIGINALWTRLIFIVLLFVSFGTAAIVYGLLWLLLPPALTAAEKLQMEGRPVTLQSIRELNEMHSSKFIKARRAHIRRTLTITIGIVSVLAAITTAIAGMAVWLRFSNIFGEVSQSTDVITSSPLIRILAAVSGVLLVLLFILCAYAAFSQKFTKRIWISSLVIIVLGLGSFGTAVGTGIYQDWQSNQLVQRNTVESAVKLPADFNAIKNLSVDIPAYVNLNYIVDPSARSIKLKSIKGLGASVSVTNATLDVHFPTNPSAAMGSSTTITIYGPQLDAITAIHGQVSYLGQQQALRIDAHQDSNVSTDASQIGTLTTTIDGNAGLVADGSAIESVSLTVSGGTNATLGNIKDLAVIAPDACATNSPINVSIQSIKNDTYTENSQRLSSSHLFTNACITITIGSDDPNNGYR